jgi:hypothetical protein
MMSKAEHYAWTVNTVHSGWDDITGDYYFSATHLVLDSDDTPSLFFRDTVDSNMYFASYVGGGSGNCVSGSDWNCELITNVGRHPDAVLKPNGNLMLVYDAEPIAISEQTSNGA